MKRLLLMCAVLALSATASAETTPRFGYEVSNILLTEDTAGNIKQVVYYRCPECTPQRADTDSNTRYFFAGKPISARQVKIYQGNSGAVSMSKASGKVLTVHFEELEN